LCGHRARFGKVLAEDRLRARLTLRLLQLRRRLGASKAQAAAPALACSAPDNRVTVTDAASAR
jgi:hypothetical protein